MSNPAVQTDSRPEVVYRARVTVTPERGGMKMVTLPFEPEPVPMGMHGPIAAHYKIPEGAFTPRASTLDYLVGSAVACLAGTLNRALQVRKIDTGGGKLQLEGIGEVEVEDGVLVVRRIRIIAHLRAPAEQRETAERVVAVYAPACPVYRSLYKAIEITTELDFVAT